MKKLLLYHHLGLGDHIICHGIVREFCKQYNTTIFCKPHNFSTVNDMFCDISNLTIIQGDDNFAHNYITSHAQNFDIIKKVGFQDLNSNENFEKQFYRLANIDFDKKWSSFYISFNQTAQIIYNQLSLPTYNFIHTDNKRNFNINISRISNEYYKFFTQDITTSSIIHYVQLIQNATEIHVIDSAFMFLIDCMSYDYSKQKLYIHRYARHNDEWLLPILNKPWIIL